MKPSMNRDVERKIVLLRKHCPWMASLLRHCLTTQNPKQCEAMRQLLTRLRMQMV